MGLSWAWRSAYPNRRAQAQLEPEAEALRQNVPNVLLHFFFARVPHLTPISDTASTNAKVFQLCGGNVRTVDICSVLIAPVAAAKRHLAHIRYAQRHGTKRPWLVRLLARRSPKIAAVALANKMARMIWAMMMTGQRYRDPVVAAA